MSASLSTGVVSNMDLEAFTATILSEWESIEGASGENQQSVCPRSPLDSSLCSSPEMCRPISRQEMKDFSFGCSGRKGTQQRQSKAKMSEKRRMKASEREKMRMRSLAEALHQLRDYLPPDYSKRGQPLTKIQTLKYTIEYINKLSDILSRA